MTTIEQMAQVVDRAATDPAYRQQLTSAPADTLRSAGIDIPAGAAVTVLENTDTLRHFVLPSRPADVSDSDLASSSAGSGGADSLAAYAQLVAATWKDGDLRSRLIADPAAVMAEYGITLPAGIEARAVDAADGSLYLVLPSLATAATTSSAGSMASSIEGSFSNLSKIITAGSYLAGLGFSIGAIIKFKQHKDNPTQTPIGTPIALVFIAAALLFLPTILGITGSGKAKDAVESGEVGADLETAAENAGLVSTGLSATAEPLETTEIS